MVHLTIDKENSIIFRDIVDAILKLDIHDSNFVWDTDGLTIQTMDPSHVSLVSLVLGKGFFQTYESGEREVVGISLVNLAKILRGNQRGNSLTVKTVDHNLEIEIRRDRQTSVFQIPCLEIEETSVNISEVTYDNRYQIPANLFQRAIQDLTLLEGTSCQLTWNESTIALSSAGHLGTASLTIDTITTKAREELHLNMAEIRKVKGVNVPCRDYCCVEKFTRSIQANFSLNYLQHFVQSAKLSPRKVCWQVSESFPLNMVVTLPGESHISFHLAPKIELDD
jgi:proliferating cell nuclear antigen